MTRLQWYCDILAEDVRERLLVSRLDVSSLIGHSEYNESQHLLLAQVLGGRHVYACLRTRCLEVLPVSKVQIAQSCLPEQGD